MRPSKAQVTKLVRLLAAYILADGAKIHHQQKRFDAYMAYLAELEEKFPKVSFRDEQSMEKLTELAKKMAGAKIFRGPGATV